MDLEILSLVFILCGIKLEHSVAQIPDSTGTLPSASPDNRIDCRYPILEQPTVSGKAKILYKCCDGWGKTHGRDAKCVRQHCPVGFKRGYSDGCYKFVTSSASWHEARNACQMTSEQSIKTRVSSDLVVIDSKEEEIFITQEIHATGMSAAWIGLREVSVDGPLMWVNGSPLDALRQNFKYGEPNENTDTNDSCVSIVNSTNDNSMKWEDRRCSNLKGYICEVRRACPPGYSQKFDNNCYRFVLDEPKDWYSARMDCKRHNFGDLLTFDQPLEIYYYNSAETLAAPRAWPMVFIGLFRGKGDWKWVTGLPLNSEYISKLQHMENNMCAVVDSTRNIKSFNCSIPMPYACEIQRNTECFKENNAQDYSGKLSMSAKGRQCNAWNETQYSRRHNYCRYTPGREQPWCFVDHGSSTTWEFCYVGEPQKFCEKGSVSVRTCNVGQCPLGSICHPVSHECICPHGYEGLHCDRLCANKRWGYKCSRECPCGGEAGNCDPVTGTARCNVTSCLVDQSNTCTQTNCGMLCLKYLGCQCEVVGECICPAYVMGVGALFLVLFAAMFVCSVLCCLRKKIIGDSHKNSFIRNLSLKHYPNDVESIDMWILPADPGIDKDSTTRESKESTDSGVETKDFHESTSLSTQLVDAQTAPIKHKPIPIKRNSSRLKKILFASKRNVNRKQENGFGFGGTPQETVDLRARCDEPPGAEYSSPYELRNKELLLCEGEGSEYYAFPDPEVLNNDVNGYVNDSVTKVRRKKIEDSRLEENCNKKIKSLSSGIQKDVINSNIKEYISLQPKTHQSFLSEWVQQKTSSRSKAKHNQQEQKIGPGVKPKPRTRQMNILISKSDLELRGDLEDLSGGRKTRSNTTSQLIEHSEDTSAPLLRSSSDSFHRRNCKGVISESKDSSTNENVARKELSVPSTVSSFLNGRVRFNKRNTAEPSVYVNERIGRQRRLSQPKQIDVYEII